MKMKLASGALLAALAVAALPWKADAQSRSGSGGYAPGGAVGGGPYGGSPGNPGAVMRPTPAGPAAPMIRSRPALPPHNPMSIPRLGTGGYTNNAIGRLPPGTRATPAGPR